MTPRATLSWLKARDLAEIALGCSVGALITGAVFAAIQEQVNDRMNERAIENAQYQVADALNEIARFKCEQHDFIAGTFKCVIWEFK